MTTIHVEQLTVGSMQENCYLVSDPQTHTAVIIDPGDDASYISDHIQAAQLVPVAICATHGHFDHIMAAGELQLMYTIPFWMNDADSFLLHRMSETAVHFLGHAVPEPPPILTRSLRANEEIRIGGISFTVLPAPGHTPGSMLFYFKKHQTVFVGDVVFDGGSVGRSDFSYSDSEMLMQSVRSVLALSPDTTVYSGHGLPTTAGQLGVYFH